MHMIQRNPEARLTAKDYLTTYGPSLFPEYFTSFLQPFCQTLLPLSADLRLAAVQQAFPQMLHFMAQKDKTKTPNAASERSASSPPLLGAEDSRAESMGGTQGASTPGAGASSKSTSGAATRPSSAHRSGAASRSGEHVFHNVSTASGIVRLKMMLTYIFMLPSRKTLQQKIACLPGENLVCHQCHYVDFCSCRKGRCCSKRLIVVHQWHDSRYSIGHTRS